FEPERAGARITAEVVAVAALRDRANPERTADRDRGDAEPTDRVADDPARRPGVGARDRGFRFLRGSEGLALAVGERRDLDRAVAVLPAALWQSARAVSAPAPRSRRFDSHSFGHASAYLPSAISFFPSWKSASATSCGVCASTRPATVSAIVRAATPARRRPS